jgi:DNA-binding GntR family transcriptional regulator
LGRILEVEKKHKTKMDDILAANEAFHLGLGEIAGNRRVLVRLKLTLEYVHRLDVLSIQTDSAWIGHGDIFAALESRKAVQARKAMAAHIDKARDRMLKLFGT